MENIIYDYYHPLFDYMAENYNLNLVISEMDDLINVIKKIERDDEEKEAVNSGYPLLGEVRAVVTEMLLPHISSDSEDVAITKMYALRNSYIDTYNNTIRDVLKKLSEHFS